MFPNKESYENACGKPCGWVDWWWQEDDGCWCTTDEVQVPQEEFIFVENIIFVVVVYLKGVPEVQDGTLSEFDCDAVLVLIWVVLRKGRGVVSFI